MTRSLKSLSIGLCMLWLLTGTAFATAPGKTGARLDSSYGKGGLATTAVPKSEKPIQMAIGKGGNVYLLQNSLLLAFEADGKPARGFGKNGRVKITSPNGEGEPVGIAVDSQGRVLVAGSTYLGKNRQLTGSHVPGATEYWPVNEAYIIRLLPNGGRDVTFGNGGEVDTDFGLPRPTGVPGAAVEFEKASVLATSMAVDSQDRPIVGGAYVRSIVPCGYIGGTPAPFVARLTLAGAIDTSFAGKGYGTIDQEGEVTALAESPGGPATISHGQSCGPRTDETRSAFNSFGESGEPDLSLDPSRPSFYMQPTIAVDPQGRILVVEIGTVFEERAAVLVRLLPSGAVDQSFGHGGGTPFAGGVIGAQTFTVDAKSRPILASTRSNGQIELMRLLANGRIDRSFGNRGSIKGGAASPGAGGVSSLGLDGRGRTYAARWVEAPSLKTGYGLQVARFMPGK
jgi:uncharacterized delta-60 repeat protein